MDDIKEKIIEQSSGVLTEAYKDVISPSAKPVGTMLSYLPRTIRLGLSKWEKWIINGEESLRLTAEALKEKVDKIPEEKQCEPEPYVAVPAIQQIAYCYDSSELRDMYANLLAASMNTDKKWNVHPGFVDIIKQLTPDEAKLLKILPKNEQAYTPLLDLQIKLGSKVTDGQKTVFRNYTMYYDMNICEAPENVGMYLENLSRLKLINILEDVHLTDDNLYKVMENAPKLTDIKKRTKLKPGQSFTFKKKVFHLTAFGMAFIKCCIIE